MPCVVGRGGSVILTATASDLDGDPLTFEWSAAHGGFSGPVDITTATWTAPTDLGRFEILVGVSDGRGGTASASVEVEVAQSPPVFGQSSYRFLLPENLDGRTRSVVLGMVTAEDADGDLKDYEIVSGDRQRFTLGARDGVVRYIGPGEDFETEPNRFELAVRARDDLGADVTARVVVEVTDVNEPPEVTVTCDPCTVARGGKVRLEAKATDPDGDPLTYAWSASAGSFSGVSGAVAYWTAPAEPGPVTIRVEVSDGRGGSAAPAATVDVFNSAPAFGQLTYVFELPENLDGRENPVELGVVAAEDPDGDPLDYEIVSGDRQRFALGARDGVVRYIGPGEDFETEPNRYELTVRARDGFGGEARTKVVIEVTDLNEPPKVTASCDPCTVARGGEVWREANATDPEGDPLTYGWSAERGAFGGSADRPAVRWTAPAELGTVAIRVEVSDGRGGSTSVVVEVEVVNRAPAFGQPSYGFELPENVDGRERSADLGRVAATDPDDDELTYEMVSGDRQRFAVGALDAEVRYVGPGEDFETGPNRFELTVRALDGFGGEARTEVVIEVTDVNEAPEAVDDRAVTPEDRAVTVDVLANDTEPDGDPLSVRSVTAPAHGAVRLVSGGVVMYTPEADFHGADSFAYVASDGRGLSDTATVEVTVLPVNDAPKAIGRVPDQTLDEGGGPVQVDVSLYFGDVDGDALTYGARSNDTGVVLASAAGAVLTLTPVLYGTATVTVTAWDPAGLAATQSVRVGVSDRPQRAVLGNVLAATARGHLASIRAALGRRMAAAPCEASRLAVMGRSVPLGRTEAESMLKRIETGARSLAATVLGLGEGAGEPFGGMRMSAEQGAPTTPAIGTVPEQGERIEAALRSVPARALGLGGGGAGAGAADFLFGWGGSQEEGERCPVRGRWSLWGQGDVERFEGTPSQDSGYDGELSTAYVGLDMRLGDRWLAGVALSRSNGASDWRAGTSEGQLTQFMTAVHPYLRWDGGSTSVWASVGAGRGDARNVRTTGRTGTSPTDLRLGLVELEQRLGAPGGFDFAIMGDAAWASLRTGDGEETIDRQDIDVNQTRIGVALSLPARLGGLALTPFGTVQARREGGAGQTGDGIEVAGGLRAVLGIVRLDAQARMLAHHSAEGYGERGAAVTLALGKQGGEAGFSLSVTPSWGGGARATGALPDGPLGGGLRRGKPDTDRWTLDARANYSVNLPGGLSLDLQGGYGADSGGLDLGLSLGMASERRSGSGR
ncbi:MAG: tandem-95 repeat protein [Gemmatimonadales bacterium]|nr:tandem-95 repeat protein [Gemmatimonadales bacterium]